MSSPTSPPRQRRGQRRLVPARAIALAIALTLGLAAFALGCGPGDAAPVDAAPPTPAPLAFQREGVPGPWWRAGATQEMFDAEHRVCLARSHEARANAEGSDPADAAYRAFLECMEQHQWSRGLPPRTS